MLIALFSFMNIAECALPESIQPPSMRVLPKFLFVISGAGTLPTLLLAGLSPWGIYTVLWLSASVVFIQPLYIYWARR
jgi:hypothetical protein